MVRFRITIKQQFQYEKLQELTQTDPANRTQVGDAGPALQNLAQYAIEGDFDRVRQLATPQLVTATDAARRTVLMLVADARETPVQAEKCILYLLMELGASPKAADDQGDTAAHLAARRDNVRVLALLAFDAKWLRNDRGLTPLMEAARTGSWKSAKHLLHLLRQRRFNEYRKYGNSKRSRLLELKDASGRTALELARQSGHSELASYIEREMRLVVDGLGRLSGLTAQEEADRQQLQWLAEAGDSGGLRRAVTRATCDLPDALAQTVMMWAARNQQCGDEALWEQLVQLGDPTCGDIFSNSCLHYAAVKGNSAAASALLDAGAPTNARDHIECTPLMLAGGSFLPSAIATAAAVIRLLLDAGADWSLKDRQERTALDRSREKKNIEAVELLCVFKDKVFFNEPLEQPVACPPFSESWNSVRIIGRGGFGEVHEVLTDKGIRCAAKTLKLPLQLGNQLDSVKSDIDRAVESERNLYRLKHVNIVKFLYIAQPEPATVVLFMELLDGRSLESFIEKKPVDETQIRKFLDQICRALLYLHSLRPPVIHRDINCSNIIVLADRKRLKLIDFGLSIKLEQSVSHMSASGQTPKGTLNFMAPELLGAGESESVQYSRESDIWAFGCSVFQMASGSRPFSQVGSFLFLAQLIDKKGAPALPDDSSAELKDFYSCCTAKDRKKRKSALELMGHAFLTGGKLNP